MEERYELRTWRRRRETESKTENEVMKKSYSKRIKYDVKLKEKKRDGKKNEKSKWIEEKNSDKND